LLLSISSGGGEMILNDTLEPKLRKENADACEVGFEFHSKFDEKSYRSAHVAALLKNGTSIFENILWSSIGLLLLPVKILIDCRKSRTRLRRKPGNHNRGL
jgi:hypothetical protein